VHENHSPHVPNVGHSVQRACDCHPEWESAYICVEPINGGETRGGGCRRFPASQPRRRRADFDRSGTGSRGEGDWIRNGIFSPQEKILQNLQGRRHRVTLYSLTQTKSPLACECGEDGHVSRNGFEPVLWYCVPEHITQLRLYFISTMGAHSLWADYAEWFM
jgi:hypothetical protein